MREGRYWEKEEKKRCKLYGGRERESWEHIWDEYREWDKIGGNWAENVE